MKRLLIIFFTLQTLILYGQDQPHKLGVGGYIKYLNIPVKTRDAPLVTTQFIHHRLNLSYFATSKIKLTLESRNRIFYGVGVSSNPNFGEQIDQYNGLLDLSVLWINNRSAVIHTQIDRAYLNWSDEKWDITIGRQRINWGLNLVWNPNDIFNALNYLDFDYEERPGNDAIRIQYFMGILSHVELAVAPGRQMKSSIASGLFKFNWRNYDFQILGGYSNRDLIAGIGWSGYIRGAGFKGEATYFDPITSLSEEPSTLSASLSADYQFNSKLYANASFLFNHTPSNDLSILNSGFGAPSGESLSPKNLFPSRWAFFAQTSYQPHPLLGISMAVLYGTQNHLTLFLPSVSYSLIENWDIDLNIQSFAFSQSQQYLLRGNAFFLRIKWSY